MLGWRDFALCFREAPFLLLMLLCFLFSLTGAFKVFAGYQSAEGTLLPMTTEVTQLAVESFFIGGLMTMMFYGGEIFARDRTVRAFLITDSAPIPDWALLLGKLCAIALLAVFLTLIPGMVALIAQAAKGYFDGDIANYVYRLILLLLPALLAFGALTLIMHTLSGSRALGHGLSIGAGLAFCIGHEVDFLSHPLSKPGLSGFHTTYSQFDAFAQFRDKLLQADAYWLLLAGALLIFGYWLWPRGIELGIRARMASLRRNISLASAISFAVTLVATLALGRSIHGQAIVANRSLSQERQIAEDAEYEKRYGGLRDSNQPKLTRADLQVDLDPLNREANYAARLVMQNQGTRPIYILHVETEPFVQIVSAHWDGTALELLSKDSRFWHTSFRLPHPLQPAQQARLSIALRVGYHGYVAKGYHGTLVKDGSVFPTAMWPRFAYNAQREVKLRGERVRHGLGQRVMPPALSDSSRGQRGYSTPDAGPVQVTLEVSVPKEQLPVAPGEMVQESLAGGRRTRVYQSNVEAIWQMPLTAAAYATRRITDPMPIEVYYNPQHAANIDRFTEAAAFAVKRLTPLLGPYPYGSIRIAEVPNGLAEPQSARGLIILPELKGWTHDYRKAQPFDYILFAVSKQLAHSWLVERTPAGWYRGAEVLQEALPEVIALSLVQERDGPEMVERYLSDRLEFYLRESVREDGIEPALVDAYDQEYLVAKAVIALWSTRAALGVDTMLAAVRELPQRAAGEHTFPWIDLGQLLASLRTRTTGDEQRAVMHEMFNSVIVYDFAAKSAMTQAEGGRYRTTFTLDARGVGVDPRARGAAGNRIPLDFHEPVEVAAVNGNGTVLSTIVKRVSRGTNYVEMVTDEPPATVVVDPADKLLDEARLNNRTPVRLAPINASLRRQ